MVDNGNQHHKFSQGQEEWQRGWRRWQGGGGGEDGGGSRRNPALVCHLKYSCPFFFYLFKHAYKAFSFDIYNE